MSETLSHAKFISEVTFNTDGLVPVITQRAQTGEVLMLGYMNRHTLELTLQSGFVTYWSRSRKKVWVKGEEFWPHPACGRSMDRLRWRHTIDEGRPDWTGVSHRRTDLLLPAN